MSISKFYEIFVNLYSGGYNSQVQSNVFDLIVAFLTFDTLSIGVMKISEQLP